MLRRSTSISLLLQYCSASFAWFWRQQTASTIASSNYRIGYCIDAATQRHVSRLRALGQQQSSSSIDGYKYRHQKQRIKKSQFNTKSQSTGNSQKHHQTYAATPLLITCPSRRFFGVYQCRPPQEVLTPATKPKNMLSTSVVS